MLKIPSEESEKAGVRETLKPGVLKLVSRS